MRCRAWACNCTRSLIHIICINLLSTQNPLFPALDEKRHDGEEEEDEVANEQSYVIIRRQGWLQLESKMN